MIVDFETFVAEHEAGLRAGLVAAYGPDVGVDVTAEALAWAWSNWPTLETMANPVGYLYRVGQSASRKHFRAQGYLPSTAPLDLPRFEPALGPALEGLTEPQRVSVVLVHALGWSLQDTADVLDISVSSVRTHIQRAMTKLRTALKVNDHAG